MTRLTLPALALALVLAVPAGAAEEITDRDRFKLWNNCKPMDLVVESLDKDLDIGLTTEAILVAVRSRLRAARLYEADAFPYLYVNVSGLSLAFVIQIYYKRWLADPASGNAGFASTWNRSAVGTHGGNPGYILSGVSRYTDRFIDEYLRVNADAC